MADAKTARAAFGRSGATLFPSSCILRVQHELQSLAREPVPFLYVHADESDITIIKALIVGPLETPYAGGCFIFDIFIKPEYPMVPPSVVFKTTDGGRVRFNPNLYSSGKVCLSVLGTWHGPAWTSAESISSVLLSIQSLMCAKPYHNEPGYENHGDDETVQAYSDYIRYETLRVAVIDMLEHPFYEEEFGNIMQRHFLMWYDMHVENVVDMKQRLDGKEYSDPFSSAKGTYEFNKLLTGLKTLKKQFMVKFQETPKQLDAVNGASRSRNLSPITFAKERLLDEHDIAVRTSPPGISCSPRDKNDPFLWDATIVGQDNTPWEGGLFPLEITFSANYPYDCPFVRFTCKTFHPNITSDGIPALDLITTRWKPETRVVTILTEIQKLIKTPSTLYPVNSEASFLYMNDRNTYDKRVRRIAQDF